MIPRLHLITDDRVLESPRFHEVAVETLEAGGDRIALHLRGPDTAARTLWDRGRALLPVSRETGARLLVNDRVDLARLLELDGVHLPEHGLPVDVARQLLRPERLVGLSVHGPERLQEGERPDFLLVGTLYPTPSHPGEAGSGPARIVRIRELAPDIPALGIGGIKPERVAAVMETGAHGVAVLRAVWEHPHPERAVATFLEELAAHGAARSSRRT